VVGVESIEKQITKWALSKKPSNIFWNQFNAKNILMMDKFTVFPHMLFNQTLIANFSFVVR